MSFCHIKSKDAQGLISWSPEQLFWVVGSTMFRAGFLYCSLAVKNIDMFSMRANDELISISSASWTCPHPQTKT